MTYCFLDEKGKPLELNLTVAELEAAEREGGIYRIDGRTLVRDYAAEHVFCRPDDLEYSTVAGSVSPGQVPELMKRVNEWGLSGRVTPEVRGPMCRLRFSDRNARKEFCQRRGFIDQDGGYGDPT